MRLERISLQLEDGEVRTFEFHSGLTVVEAEPDGGAGLSQALLGTLSSGGDGVHVEFSLDDGSYEVAFRPFGSSHLVIDTETSSDRSERYRRADGGIDVLAPFGGRQRARDLVVGVDELSGAEPSDGWVAQLAGHDVDALVRTATEAVAAEDALRSSTAGAGRSPGPHVGHEVRQKAIDAERRFRVLLPTTAVVGSGLAIGAAVGVEAIGTAGALALIGASLALVSGTLLYGRTVNAALTADEALSGPAVGPGPAGADADTTTGEGDAIGLPAAAEQHRRAAAAWQQVAGTIPASWALGERTRIERAARLRQGATADGSGAAALGATPAASAVMAALTVRMASSYSEGEQPESLPLFLDDPLSDLEWADKAPVLELLGRLAAAHQLVLVTADPAVLSWARLEAMAGTVGAITAPGGQDEPADAEAAPPSRAA